MKVYIVLESEYLNYEGLQSKEVVATFSTAEKAHTSIQDSDSYGHYKYNRENEVYEDLSTREYGYVYGVEVEEHWMEGEIK